ncbi:hypothetical protein V495_01847 [Pseudogymnoascus sp. VKM F-4514 (FW-929)]|nr:hypothetical protein V495_01847 [Pseudogymnoascus sp. VKM F-4514 (FW-929)]
MSVVIPAYNEEERLEVMLEEAVAYLDAEYGRVTPSSTTSKSASKSKSSKSKSPSPPAHPTGYEILLVNDGSSDSTVQTALRFSHAHALHDTLRIVSLTRNRGKGGAVTHGLRHVRGTHAVFADADGASRFRDLGALVAGAELVKDSGSRAVAVGSRAHLVGSEAVVKRSFIRNALMHSFHLLLRLLTPPATSRIRDTQCGFKLFTRAALPHIVPYMHAEGWIFDVEMLMLAESAPFSIPGPGAGKGGGQGGKIGGAVRGVRVAEVPIAWQEVGGTSHGSALQGDAEMPILLNARQTPCLYFPKPSSLPPAHAILLFVSTQPKRQAHHFNSEKMYGKISAIAFHSTAPLLYIPTGALHSPIKLPTLSHMSSHIVSSATEKKW